jgi:hypothetical protein
VIKFNLKVFSMLIHKFNLPYPSIQNTSESLIYLSSVKIQYLKKCYIVKSFSLRNVKIVFRSVSRRITIFSHLNLKNLLLVQKIAWTSNHKISSILNAFSFNCIAASFWKLFDETNKNIETTNAKFKKITLLIVTFHIDINLPYQYGKLELSEGFFTT